MGRLLIRNLTLSQDVLSFTALAIFTRSPAAYDALKSFKLLQLPSVRTLKYYIDANLEEGGDCLKRLEEERRHYVLMKEQKKQELADGSKQRGNKY